MYFYEIASTGSMQAAARSLGLSAPTISYSTRQLEAVLGVELFHRSSRGVSLTEAGEKLYGFCRRFYRDLDDVQRQLLQPGADVPVKVRIGTFQSIAIYYWPLLLDVLSEESQISVSITTNRSKAILESLVRREIDVALTVDSMAHGNLIRHELYEDEYAFYCAADRKKRVVKESELDELALIYIPDASDEDGKTLRQYLHQWGVRFRDEVELDSLEVVGEFTRRGTGVGILPTRVARTFGKELRAVRVEGAPERRFGTHRFYLSHRDDLELPQSVVTLLLRAARKAVRRLNG